MQVKSYGYQNRRNREWFKNYKIHFYFKNETEEYYGWGYEITMEEAEEVEKKIKEFLKKCNDIDLSS